MENQSICKGDLLMYENGQAFDSYGNYLGECNVPDFDNIEDMESHGFVQSDIQEDEKGRYLESSNPSSFGF